MQGDENDHSLIGQTKKGIGKGPNKGKEKSEESSSQLGNKDLPETLAETQMNEFSSKFDNDFSMVSCLSFHTFSKNTWYVDNGALRHMTSARELFLSLIEHSLKFKSSLVMMPMLASIQ